MTAEEIVEENFKGLSGIIKDAELCHWYKELIITCLDEHAEQQAEAFAEWMGNGALDFIQGERRKWGKFTVDRKIGNLYTLYTTAELYQQFLNREK